MHLIDRTWRRLWGISHPSGHEDLLEQARSAQEEATRALTRLRSLLDELERELLKRRGGEGDV